jgi:hypothetical protein
MRPTIVAAAAFTLLAGCATLSESQCRSQDWLGVGEKDGLAGRGPERIEAHAEACARYSVLPDPVAYERGREAGLRRFCTPTGGYRHGEAGRTYEGVCPPEAEGGFLRAYSDGLLVHAAEQAADRAASAASSARADANRAERQIAEAERRAADEKLSADERQAARDSIAGLRRERSRALYEARAAEAEERDARFEASRLRARFAAYYGGA